MLTMLKEVRSLSLSFFLSFFLFLSLFFLSLSLLLSLFPFYDAMMLNTNSIKINYHQLSQIVCISISQAYYHIVINPLGGCTLKLFLSKTMFQDEEEEVVVPPLHFVAAAVHDPHTPGDLLNLIQSNGSVTAYQTHAYHNRDVPYHTPSTPCTPQTPLTPTSPEKLFRNLNSSNTRGALVDNGDSFVFPPSSDASSSASPFPRPASPSFVRNTSIDWSTCKMVRALESVNWGIETRKVCVCVCVCVCF